MTRPRVRYDIPGWTTEYVVEGKTGWIFKDTPVLIQYNSEKNIVSIVFRGTGNGGDWATNLLATLLSILCLGRGPMRGEQFSIPGKRGGEIDRGFWGKYQHCKEDLEKGLSRLWTRIETQGRTKGLQFIVTGHSQGAALASIACVDLVQNFLRTKYPTESSGEAYKNAQFNRLYGVFLSPPSIASALTRDLPHIVDAFNALVGKHNVFSYSVSKDPMTLFGIRHHHVCGYLGTKFVLEALQEGAIQNGRRFRNRLRDGDVGEIVCLCLAIPLLQRRLLPPYLRVFATWTVGLSYTFGFLAPIHLGSIQHAPTGTFDPELLPVPQEALEKGYLLQQSTEEEIIAQERRIEELIEDRRRRDEMVPPVGVAAEVPVGQVPGSVWLNAPCLLTPAITASLLLLVNRLLR